MKRDLRLENKKIEKGTSSAFREQERDVSEKIALGQAAPVAKESMFDSRLYNQDAGLQSGFSADDSYDLYSKPLFSGSSTATLYRPKAGGADMDDEGAAAAAATSMGGRAGAGAGARHAGESETAKFKADRAFSGTEHGTVGGQSRSKPVEFERDAADADDPYGLGHLLSSSETRRPSALQKIGSEGPAMGLGRETAAGQERTMQFREGSSAAAAASYSSSSSSRRGGDDRDRRSRHSRSRSPRRSRSRSREKRRH